MKKSIRILLLILLAALSIRIVSVLEMRKFPVYYHPQLDEMEYEGWGLQIASGQLLWHYIPIHSPGYAFFMAFNDKLSPYALTTSRLMQSFISAFTVLLIFILARKLFDERSALISAGLAALFWPMVYFQARLLPPTFHICFMLLGLLAALSVDKRPASSGLLSGLCVGLSAIFWPLSLSLAPALAIWFGAAKDWRKISRSVPLFIFGLLIPIIPVTIQNYRAEKDFILLQEDFGLNFYLGNNQKSPGIPYLRPGGEWDYLQAMPVREAGIERGSEQDRFYLKKWGQWAGKHPASWLNLLTRKTKLLLDNREIISSFDPEFYRAQMISLRVTVVNSALVIALGLVGLFSMRSGRNRFLLPALCIFFLGLALILTLISSRYRLGFMSLLLIPAGSAVNEIYEALKAKNELRFWGLILSAGVIMALSLIPWPLVPLQTGYEFVHIGQALKASGNLDGARSSFKRAWGYRASQASGWLGLAQVSQMEGNMDEAEADIKQSIKLDNGYSMAHVVLGSIYLQKEDLASGLEEFRTAINLRPQYVYAWLGYADTLIRAGEYEQAQKAIDKVTSLNPDLPDILILRSKMALARGDRDEVLRLLKSYRKIKPGDAAIQGMVEEIERQ
jgi:Tfp pilus assembly protein PilF